MKTMKLFAALALLAATPAFASGTNKKPNTKAEAVSLNPDQLQWGAAPPNLPKGAQLAVLQGDPSKKAPFVMRLKMPAGYKIAPHWHSADEEVTVLSGTFVLHMGDTMDAPGATLEAGGFHFLPAKMHHAAEAKEETIVQVNGMGPFDIHYLNPAEDPSKQAAE